MYIKLIKIKKISVVSINVMLRPKQKIKEHKTIFERRQAEQN